MLDPYQWRCSSSMQSSWRPRDPTCMIFSGPSTSAGEIETSSALSRPTGSRYTRGVLFHRLIPRSAQRPAQAKIWESPGELHMHELERQRTPSLLIPLHHHPDFGSCSQRWPQTAARPMQKRPSSNHCHIETASSISRKVASIIPTRSSSQHWPFQSFYVKCRCLLSSMKQFTYTLPTYLLVR